MNKPIILLVGKSGSGKTTIAKYLKKQYGWQDIDSYTTRPPRYQNEAGHIFITEEQFDQIKPEDMCAYTLFNGYRYCATIEQADKADIYVVDVDGVKRFKERYVKHNPARQIFVVYLDTPEWELKKRMTHRGDSPEKINSRLQHDREAFKEAADIADHILDGRVEVNLNAMYLYNLATGQLGHYTDV
ncbi:AAA family ATPase [Butyrivibrio sp.]|uniref:AAA family ATPase n=1 Tax=Butyrivibrio sp. TaxID=28121 RepID=UPI0025BEC45C|nr:AAA family ATPase [Butyrivibrio sp.]MBQ7431165.1 AAA family ATPase [Butyrivibrio sp.]MBQ9302515.1 AAA family ATPase [Butyrivibrio sp.]